MPVDKALHVMAVCNACRYCEQYCPVFPAMEQRMIAKAVKQARYMGLLPFVATAG